MYPINCVLEVPSKDGTSEIGITHVGANRFVIASKDEADNLGAQMLKWNSENLFNDEQYKAFVDRSRAEGIPCNYHPEHGESPLHGRPFSPSKVVPGSPLRDPLGPLHRSGLQGSYGYWASNYASPMRSYWGGSVIPDGRVVKKSEKIIGESNYFANQGKQESVHKSQISTEKEVEERQRAYDTELSHRNNNMSQVGHTEKWVELDHSYFQNSRFLFSADSSGDIKQWSLKDSNCVKDFEKTLHKRTVYAIASTTNSKY